MHGPRPLAALYKTLLNAQTKRITYWLSHETGSSIKSRKMVLGVTGLEAGRLLRSESRQVECTACSLLPELGDRSVTRSPAS